MTMILRLTFPRSINRLFLPSNCQPLLFSRGNTTSIDNAASSLCVRQQRSRARRPAVGQPSPIRALWPHTAGQHMSRAAFSCCDGSSSKSRSLQFITTLGRRFRVLRETCQRSWIVFQSCPRSRRGRRGGNLQAWHLTCCNTIPCTWHYFSPSLLKGHKLWTHRSSFFFCSCGKHKSCKAGAVTWPVPEVI